MSNIRMIKRKASLYYREEDPVLPSKNTAHFDRRYICRQCGARHKSPSALSSHLRVHNGERPFECDICGKRFKISQHLKDHKGTHTGAKPLACQFCGKKFLQGSNLRQHELRYHPGLKYYPCQYCTERFETYEELKSHQEKHQDLIRQVKRGRRSKLTLEPFVCRYCPSRFSQKNKLSAHVQWHLDGNKAELPQPRISPSPPKPPIRHYKARILRKRSVSPDSPPPEVRGKEPALDRVEMIVKCRFCPREFTAASALQVHMSRVHVSTTKGFKRPNILRSPISNNKSPSQNLRINGNGLQTGVGVVKRLLVPIRTTPNTNSNIKIINSYSTNIILSPPIQPSSNFMLDEEEDIDESEQIPEEIKPIVLETLLIDPPPDEVETVRVKEEVVDYDEAILGM